MKIYLNPSRERWENLCKRPQPKADDNASLVSDILKKVKTEGDTALKFYAEKFDEVQLSSIMVTLAEFEEAKKLVAQDLKESIALAQRNIEKFHASQLREEAEIETQTGVRCWRKSVAIEKVGLYIPGGTAPLFSTLLMLGIPAQLAGCQELVVCTPPRKDGSIDPAILFTAQALGITQLYKVGGAQAIAAMAYGTESIPQVYKIFGPGNSFVTKAKQLVQEEGVAIDMPAGPSEVLVIADETAVPSFVAADLLSQAEHGSDSQVVLVCTSENIAGAVSKEVKQQLKELPRAELASKALNNSFAIVLEDLDVAMEFSNSYAPEHLIIASDHAESYASLVRNAGSVFLGNYSCESAGDYASGTNHTLPTNAFARNYSGVSVDSFVKKITFQSLSKEGLKNIGPAIEVMAAAEGLQAHKNAVSLRLKNMEL